MDFTDELLLATLLVSIEADSGRLSLLGRVVFRACKDRCSSRATLVEEFSLGELPAMLHTM